MTAKNKIRGNQVERETVKAFEAARYKARRAWGSDGRSMGLAEDIDVWVTFDGKRFRDVNIKIQCKRKKKLPDWLGFSDNVDAVVVREDRGQLFIIMKLEDYLK